MKLRNLEPFGRHFGPEEPGPPPLTGKEREAEAGRALQGLGFRV